MTESLQSLQSWWRVGKKKENLPGTSQRECRRGRIRVRCWDGKRYSHRFPIFVILTSFMLVTSQYIRDVLRIVIAPSFALSGFESPTWTADVLYDLAVSISVMSPCFKCKSLQNRIVFGTLNYIPNNAFWWSHWLTLPPDDWALSKPLNGISCGPKIAQGSHSRNTKSLILSITARSGDRIPLLPDCNALRPVIKFVNWRNTEYQFTRRCNVTNPTIPTTETAPWRCNTV